MPVDWRLLNRDFGQQLGQALDPNIAAERQNRLSDLAQNRQMKQMQIQSVMEDRRNRAASEQQRQSAMQGLSPEDIQQIQLGVPYKDIVAQKQQASTLADLQRGLTGAPEARPLQGQVFGQFDLSTPEKQAQLLKDMERLPPSEQAGMREALMQQGAIQPRTIAPTPEQRNAAIAQFAASGGKGADVIQRLYKPESVMDFNKPFLPSGQPNVAFQQYEREKALSGKPPSDVNWQAVQTENGLVQINPKTGEIRDLGISKPSAVKALTEGQAKATTFVSQMNEASNALDKIEQKGFDPSNKSNQLLSKLAGGALNVFVPPDAQQYKQMQNQWSEPFLRVKTGAAATMGEVELNNKTFFPQFGDDKATVDRKRIARAAAERDVLNMAGRGAELVTKREQQPMAQGQYDAGKEARYQAWKAQQVMK